MNAFYSNKTQNTQNSNLETQSYACVTITARAQKSNTGLSNAPQSDELLNEDANFEASLMREMLYFDRF